MTATPDPADAMRAQASERTTDAAADGAFQLAGTRGFRTPAELVAWAATGASLTAAETQMLATWAARGLELETWHDADDYHEDMGPVLWWTHPVSEPPVAGVLGDSDVPAHATHFSPIPHAWTTWDRPPRTGG